MYDHNHLKQHYALHTPLKQDQSCAIMAALNDPHLAGLTIRELLVNTSIPRAQIVIPESWKSFAVDTNLRNIVGQDDQHMSHSRNASEMLHGWTAITNAKFATRLDTRWLMRILEQLNIDVAVVNVSTDQAAYRESIRMTSAGKVAGFRRHYSDAAVLSPMPKDWSHHIFIKNALLYEHQDLIDHTHNFHDFIEHCHRRHISVRAIIVPGAALDLSSESGLMTFYKMALTTSKYKIQQGEHQFSYGNCFNCNNISIAAGARLFGTVVLGENVRIDKNAIILGPAIIGSNVSIGAGAVVKTSIISPNCSVLPKTVTSDRIVISDLDQQRSRQREHPAHSIMSFQQQPMAAEHEKQRNFRQWPWYSYPRLIKPVADIVLAAIILILTMPVIAIVALVVRLESKGPVLFGHKRQGLHGRMFNCTKFRTMITGADNMQDLLRSINQVDGPQFKIDLDPRITKLGKFLRSSYLDELPQLFNVVTGKMSLVGPRPSPPQENVLCPAWHDARLSVKPGMTGLWQINRTRMPNCDFQEWLLYDTEYVKNISIGLDLLIVYKTAIKVLIAIVKAFYSSKTRKEM